MKILLCLIFSLSGCAIMAQNTLLGGAALLEIDGQKVQVQQTLDIQLSDSVQQLRLRILDFDGSSLTNISVTANGKEIPFKVNEADGIRSLDLVSSEGFQQLKIAYGVKVMRSDFYIPLFFTDLAAADSENEFFKVALRLPQAQAYTLHFPSLSTKETTKGDKKVVEMELPALISVVRMELLDGKKSIGFAGVMDVMVVLIFVVMGLVIWIKRKHLVYG